MPNALLRLAVSALVTANQHIMHILHVIWHYCNTLPGCRVVVVTEHVTHAA